MITLAYYRFCWKADKVKGKSRSTQTIKHRVDKSNDLFVEPIEEFIDKDIESLEEISFPTLP